MKITRLVMMSAALTLLSFSAQAQGKTSPPDALVYIIWPQNGAVIKGAFWCRFGLRNMNVSHYSDEFKNSGHHHLFIDATESVNQNEPIPQDKNHLHFGLGQTEGRIELPPGKHTLQLVFGDGNHYPFTPPVESERVTITVK
jgi:uncharacterized protein DUF4399